MTRTSLSAARSTRRGGKLPTPAHRCAATRGAVAGRMQWHRLARRGGHSCLPREGSQPTKGLCAFAKPSTQRMAQLVTSQPFQFPWPPSSGRLMANARLTFSLNDRKTSPLRISNRERMAVFHFILRPPTPRPGAPWDAPQARTTERTERAEASLALTLNLRFRD
jgi:hypothetical protein